MSKVIISKIENEIKSLTESTYLQITTRDYGVLYNGRNSEYISHQSVIYNDYGHETQMMIHIYNTKSEIFISRIEPKENFLTKSVLFPAFLIKRISPDFHWTEWVNHLVYVTIVDRFNGFTKSGLPIFAKGKPYVRFAGEDKKVFMDVNPDNSPKEFDPLENLILRIDNIEEKSDGETLMISQKIPYKTFGELKQDYFFGDKEFSEEEKKEIYDFLVEHY
jgi:hypothetical protein